MIIAKSWLVLIVLALAGAAPGVVTSAHAIGVNPYVGSFSCRAPKVIDGGTLLCGGETIHLRGVQAPAGGRWKREAERLLTRLTRVEVHCGAKRVGVWVGKCSTDQTPDLGGAIIQSGLATYDGDGDDRYAFEEQGARAAGRGLWKTDAGRQKAETRKDKAK